MVTSVYKEFKMKILSFYVIFFMSLSIVSFFHIQAREHIQSVSSHILQIPSDRSHFVTTPLHELIMKYYVNKHEKLNNLQEILNSGIDVNARNEDRRTPLWLGTFYGVEPEFIDLLIKYGADVTIPDIFNVIPLRNAVDRNDKIVAQLILDAAADMKRDTVERMLTFKDDAEYSPRDMSDTPEMDEILENAELNLQ